MSRIAVRIISILTAAALLLCAVGCDITQLSGETVENPGRAKEGRYAELYEKGMIVPNNIVIEDVSLNENNPYINYYTQISGLRDKEIERKINDDIKARFDYLMSDDYMPKYRGLQARLRMMDEYYTESDVRCTVMGNFNDLLSICLTRSMECRSVSDENDSLYCTTEQPVTYDLATGEALTIADLFDKKTDYIERVNDAVDRALMKKGYDSGYDGGDPDYDYGDMLTLVAPFKTIKPEQKFYIGYDGGLNIVLDDETPEFDVGFFYSNLDIGMQDEMTISGRSEENLYEDGTVSYAFMDKKYPETDDDRTFDYIDHNKGIRTNCQYSVYVGMTDAQKDAVKDTVYDYSALPFDPEKVYEENAEAMDENGMDLTITGNTLCYGDYVSTDTQYRIYYMLADDYEDQHMLTCSRCCCYKGDDAKPVSLEELFKEPEKAYELLTDATAASVMRDMECGEAQAREFAEYIIPLANGACVCSDSLSLSFSVPMQDIENEVCRIFEIEDGPYGYIFCAQYPKYSDIGCEKLNIFD